MSFTVLVVDDKVENIKLIHGLIRSVTSEVNNIQSASSIFAAKEILSIDAIDLLVVDIALPQKPDESPIANGGIRLLQEIFRKQKYQKPRYVIGVTEMEVISPEVEQYFEDNLWFLLYSRSGSQIWKERFKNFFEKIVDANIPSSFEEYGFDVFVIGSKPDVELRALRDLPLDWSAPRPIDDSQFFREAIFYIGGRSFHIGIGAPPRLGLVSATMYSYKVIAKLRPRFLCMTGICAGIKGECNLGDIILAEESWEWQTGKYISSLEKFRIEPYQINVPQYITTRVKQLGEDSTFLGSLHSDWRGQKPSAASVLMSGPLASGSAVLADERMVDLVKEQHRKLLGIDMEIYGSYYSAVNSSLPRPSFFALKSVSDFANEEKDDDYQEYCSYVSAHVMLEFLQRYLPDLISQAGRF